jgi:bifunctional non-homologous end joining protein LigD
LADLRKQSLFERKKRLKAILPRDKLIAFSAHRKGNGTKFFAEAERKGLEGIMASAPIAHMRPEAGLRIG